MFEVRLTPEAKTIIERAVAKHVGPKPGLMIHRQGPTGDVSRTPSGDTAWSIERRHPWAIQIGSYETIADDDESIMFIDGIRVWLPLIPREGERGVIVGVRNGQLHVDSIDA